MKTTAIISAEFAGLHHWPDAPEDVKFLRTPHRHLFKVRVGISENHDVAKDTRETEFILFKATLIRCFPLLGKPCTEADYIDLGTQSCENIAAKLFYYLAGLRYSISFVEVFEDGENGARVEADPKDTP